MKRALIVAVLALVAGLAAMPVAAQDATQKLQVNDVDLSGHPRVALTVTAPGDLAQKPLSADAFTVAENGNPVQVDVTPLRNDVLQVVLVMDTSGSMVGPPMTAARRSAADFLQQFPAGVEFSVVGFGSEARVLTPFSDNLATHLEAVEGLEASGETALYDGLSTAAKQFARKGGRRAIVVLSDGGDTASTTPLQTTRRRLDGSKAAVYAIRYTTAETNQAALDVLAVRGRVISASSAAGLADVYDTIAGELVSQYRLAWTSGAGGATPVDIAIEQGNAAAATRLMLDLPRLAAPPEEPEPSPSPAPQVQAAPAPDPRLLGNQTALLVGAILFFLGIAGLFLFAVAPRQRRIRLGEGAVQAQAGLSRNLTEITQHAVQAAERGLERRGMTARLNLALENAGINLRPAEFLVVMFCLTLTALALGSVLGGLLIGLLLAAAVLILARFYVSHRISRRRSKFADQLSDTLQLLAGSVRAGYGMLQAIDSVAQEAPEPTSQEFRRLVVEARLGRDLTSALQAMAARLANEDFEWVVQAIMIHREVGGDLAEVLDTVGGTIRERNQIRRQIKALSAEGKLSGIVLAIIPLAVGLLIGATNPGYLRPLFTTLPGIALSVLGAIMMIIGGLWMRKTVRLVF